MHQCNCLRCRYTYLCNYVKICTYTYVWPGVSVSHVVQHCFSAQSYVKLVLYPCPFLLTVFFHLAQYMCRCVHCKVVVIRLISQMLNACRLRTVLFLHDITTIHMESFPNKTPYKLLRVHVAGNKTSKLKVIELVFPGLTLNIPRSYRSTYVCTYLVVCVLCW